jgi:PsbN protein|tara:strand:- start:6 stop:119 length:114 start_codon:yes stop_codon:yes gene_type:complete
MIVVIGLTVVVMTAYGVYMSFGPPSKNLTDSFEEHED